MLTIGPVPMAASEIGKAAPLGLLVILLLCVAVYLLGRSMVTHLKRVPESFDEPPKDDPDSG
ncbi:MAG TPA: hypothetical protein VFX70_17240 [Mycobacteriales bacterium]|nr:hypothetical protein [Mycobacteriales bacterium]